MNSVQDIKIHSLANRIKELTFWELDELVEEMKNISPTFPNSFKQLYTKTLKNEGISNE